MSQDSINASIEKSAGLTIAFTIYQYTQSLVVVCPAFFKSEHHRLMVYAGNLSNARCDPDSFEVFGARCKCWLYSYWHPVDQHFDYPTTNIDQPQYIAHQPFSNKTAPRNGTQFV